MPDRLPEHAASRRNHALFEDFARRLLEEEIVSMLSCAVLSSCVIGELTICVRPTPQVAIGPWGYSGTLQHGGILLYPTTATRALLVGIVFLNAGFPDFVGGSGSGPMRFPPFGPASGSLLPRSQPFQPVMHHAAFEHQARMKSSFQLLVGRTLFRTPTRS